MRREPRTYLELAMVNVGMFGAPKALAYFGMWAWLADQLGHWPTPEEFGEKFLLSRSQAFRRQALMRKAFGRDDLDVMWQWVLDQVDVRPASDRSGRAFGFQVGMLGL